MGPALSGRRGEGEGAQNLLLGVVAVTLQLSRTAGLGSEVLQEVSAPWKNVAHGKL